MTLITARFPGRVPVTYKEMVSSVEVSDHQDFDMQGNNGSWTMLKGQNRVRCFGCFKFGHKIADCWYGITATQIVSVPVSNRFSNLNSVCAKCNMICCACKDSDNTKSNSYSSDQTDSILS